jgi:hypothetical protein
MVNPITHLMAAALLAAATAGPLHAETWNQAHGNSMNAGYANLTTAPATAPTRVIENYGPFAPGAGFAIASNGYVFVGNERGGVFGFNAEGTATPFAVTLEPGESIAGAPVIGPGDDVYVVAVKGRGGNQPESSLARYSIGGVVKDRMLFPQHGGSRGEVMGAPTLFLTGNGANALIATVVAYPNRASGGVETRLVTFVNGDLFLDQRVDILVPETSDADVAAAPLLEPRGGVAIFTPGSGPHPYFLVGDGHQSLSGFRFTNAGLVEDFHLRDDSRFHSIVGTPSISPDGHYYVGTTKGLMIGKPANQLPLFTKKEMKTNAPATRLPDGQRVAIAGRKALDYFGGAQHGSSNVFGSEIHTAIAASQTHYYVATRNEFLSYKMYQFEAIGRVAWQNGGWNPPAIGPKGHVYAMTDSQIFIFPPPPAGPFDVVGVFQPGQGGTIAETDGNAGSATAANGAAVVMQPALPIAPMGEPASQTPVQSQRFEPPITTNGNRLFACEKLDGDDCDKGDYKAISLAFCQVQGFTKVEDYDVDSRKVPAETLDGRFCSKNKCKVFDTIACANN